MKTTVSLPPKESHFQENGLAYMNKKLLPISCHSGSEAWKKIIFINGVHAYFIIKDITRFYSICLTDNYFLNYFLFQIQYSTRVTVFVFPRIILLFRQNVVAFTVYYIHVMLQWCLSISLSSFFRRFVFPTNTGILLKLHICLFPTP